MSDKELIAEARQPSEDASGAISAVLNRLDELNNGGISYEVYSELHDLVSAIPTAVPDAAIRELTEAIRLTVEYTGNDMLPAIEGWDWYDALVKYAPEVAQAFVDKPIHFPKPTDAEAERAAAEKAWNRCVGEMPIDPDWKNFYGDNNPYREETK